MSKPLFALRKGDVMATVLQWLKQENFHMPAAMLASAASDQKLEVAAPERVPPAHLEALLQLAMAQAHGVPSEKIAALGGPHDVDLLAEWKSTPLHAALQTLLPLVSMASCCVAQTRHVHTCFAPPVACARDLCKNASVLAGAAAAAARSDGIALRGADATHMLASRRPWRARASCARAGARAGCHRHCCGPC